MIVPLFARYPTHRGHAMQGGLVLCVAGLLGASFAQTPSPSLLSPSPPHLYFNQCLVFADTGLLLPSVHLLLGQGVAYSLGGSVLYFAASSFRECDLWRAVFPRFGRVIRRWFSDVRCAVLYSLGVVRRSQGFRKRNHLCRYRMRRSDHAA